MNRTKIEWADTVWNPITGCTPVSDGCRNCYAKRMAYRLRGRYGYPKDEPFKVIYHQERLGEPYDWKKPKRIFVCSMGDLFHENVTIDQCERIWRTMLANPQHTYLMLTKRPENIPKWDWFKNHSNWWFGITVCNQQEADEKIPILFQIPATKRFICVEPILGEIDLDKTCPGGREVKSGWCWRSDLAWVICGSESGPNRRPAKIEWIRSLRDQCVKAGVPFYLKQMEIDGRLVKLPFLDGKQWLEMPE